MPSSNVRWPVPLLRQRIFYPGQFGVPGTDSEEGIRTDSHGTIFYVDPNAAGVSDARDGTDPRHPFQTVAAALTHCVAYHGDVIAVMAANTNPYRDASLGRLVVISEEVTVSVPGVRLVGVCPSGATGVWWTPASNGGTCVTVIANDVTVEGFAFSEGRTYTGCNGIYAEYDGTTTFGDYTTVRNCFFDDTVDIGVQLEFAWHCDIHDNVFIECDDYGVYCDPTGSWTDYTMVHHNWFHDVGVGGGGAIYLPGAQSCKIAYNQIYNIYAQAGMAATNEGICTGDPTVGGGVTGAYNIVHHNVLSCALPGGGAGDYDDFCEADDVPLGTQTDAWIHNYCMNGPSTTIPT